MHERTLLGQILTDNDVFYKLQPKLWWFTEPKNRRVFQAIESVLDEGARADIVNVGLKYDAGYVSSLTDEISTTANAKYYADLCKQGGTREELRRLSNILKSKTEPVETLLQQIDDTVDRVVSGGDEYIIQKAGDMLVPVIDELEERYNERGRIPGIETGFEKLDNILMGFQDEILYVIGARPSQGKSALMLNIASHISAHKRVGIITLESGWREVLIRELSSISKINSQRLVSGFFSRNDFYRLTDAAGKISERELYIYDRPNADITTVVGQARRMVNRYKCDIVFIDYLQLVRVRDAENRIDQVGRASMRLKDLSRELHIPIVVAAQLRRDSDGRRPTLGDFQHSSQIEQDADAGMLIYHKIVDANGKNLHKTAVENDGERDDIYLLIDKNRDGRTGAVALEFDAEHVTFREGA